MSSKEETDRETAHKVLSVADALAQGKLPTTGQAAAAVQKLEDEGTLLEAAQGMNITGRTTMRDAEKLLDTSKRLLLEKSPDDQIQKLIFYGSRAVQTISQTASRSDVPQDVTHEVKEILDRMREAVRRSAGLARLVVTSGEFRQLLRESWDLVKDILKTQGSEATKSTVEAIEQGKPAQLASNVSSKLSETTSAFASPDLSHGEKLDTAIEKSKEAAGEISKTVPEPVKQAASQSAETLLGGTSGDAPSSSASLSSTTTVKNLAQASAQTSSSSPQQVTEETTETTVPALPTPTPTATSKIFEPTQSSQISIGQGLDAIESTMREATTQALDSLPQDAKHAASLIASDTGLSELGSRATDLVQSALSSSTSFDILAKDLAGLLPRLAQTLAFVPVPRIEIENEDYLFVFDNVVVKCTDIVPTYMRVRTDTLVDTARAENDQIVNVVEITLSRIKASAKDIAFMYNKRTGLVQMGDVGLLDFSVTGESGLSLKLVLEPAIAESVSSASVKVLKSEVDIDDLDFVLHDTKHDTMYSLLKPLVHPFIKSRLQSGISEFTSTFLESSIKKLAGSVGAIGKGEGSVEVGKIRGPAPEYASKAFDVTAEGA